MTSPWLNEFPFLPDTPLIRATLDSLAMIVVFALLLKTLGRFISPRIRYALWLLVVARLMMPAPLSAPFGGASWCFQEKSEIISQHSGSSLPLVIPPPSQQLHPSKGMEKPIDSSKKEESPAIAEAKRPRSKETQRGSRTLPVASFMAPTLPRPSRPGSLPKPEAPASSWIPWIWFFGLIFFAVRWGVTERRFAKRLRRAKQVRDEGPLKQLREWKERMGVRREVTLVESSCVSSPAIVGLFRVRLILPKNWRDQFEDADLDAVFGHELAHVRRGDVGLNALLTALLCVYWFHPLIRWAWSRLREEQDSVRDADALRRGALEPNAYAATILATVRPKNYTPAPTAPLGFASAHHDVKRRILAVLAHQKNRRLSLILGLPVFATLGWLSLTTSAANAPDGKNRDGHQTRSVEVFRTSEALDWKESIQDILNMKIEVSFEDVEFQDAIAYLKELTDVNIVIHYSFFDVFDLDEVINLHSRSMSFENVLQAICHPFELNYTYVDDAILLGTKDEIMDPRELRFYAIGPIIESDDEDKTHDRIQKIEELVNECVTPEYFSNWGDTRYWDGLLCLTHTSKGHAQVKEFLEAVLIENESPEKVPSWKLMIKDELSRKVERIAFENEELQIVAETLGTMWSLPFVVHSDLEGMEVTLELENVSRRTVLNWIGRNTETHVKIEHGCIQFVEEPQLRRKFYRIPWELPTDPDACEDHIASLMDLIQTTAQIDPDWCQIYHWEKTLIIDTFPNTHTQIKGLIDGLNKAFQVTR